LLAKKKGRPVGAPITKGASRRPFDLKSLLMESHRIPPVSLQALDIRAQVCSRSSSELVHLQEKLCKY
jgi:hypothetical protein